MTRPLAASFLRVTASVLVSLAVAVPSLAATSPDLSGSWLGTFKIRKEKGPDSKGVIGFDFVQTSDTGTFDGLSTTRGSEIKTSFEGVYTLEGRRIAGSFTAHRDNEPPETGSLAGKCNKKQTRMKLVAYYADGTKLKIKLMRFLLLSP